MSDLNPEIERSVDLIREGNEAIDTAARIATSESPAPSPPSTDEWVGIRTVPVDEFVAVDEQGAGAVLGERGAPVMPEGGNVMVYGDYGVGKTTLVDDLAFHLAAGDDWLGIPVRIADHVLPTLGTYPIDEVTVVDLRRLIDKLGRSLAPSTVTGIVSMISSLMRYAVRQRIIERNVVRDLDRDDRPGVTRQSEPRYLSVDEVALLLSKLTDTFRPVATVCAYAGLRISEALGLTWADVDLNTKTINVRRQLDDDLTLRNETKTAASTAIVPMLPALERELRAHRVQQASVGLRLVHRDALLFTTTSGQPQSRRNALRALHAAGEAAGLNGDYVEPVGLHDLRHSLVALVLDSGRSLAEAAVLARHANARVTGQIYAGVSESSKAKIASKLVEAGIGA